MPPHLRPLVPALAVLAAIGCGTEGPPPAGTLVGNPGKTEMVAARLDGLELEAAQAEGVTAELVGCENDRASVIDHADTAPLIGGEPYVVPGGSWCGLTLDVERITGSGTGLETSTFELTLEPAAVITLWAAEPVVVDETDYVLEIASPGWLTREDLPPPEGEGQPSVIAPESEIAALLVLEVLEGTAWYADDGDGVIDEAERAIGPIAATGFPPPVALGGEEGEDTAVDTSVAFEGCGNCGTTGGPSGWIWAAVAALTARRRTGGRPRPAAR